MTTETISIPKDLAAGLAIRVEDAMKTMNSLLDGAEDSVSPNDWKRKSLIIMARDRASHLDYVAKKLRGEA